MDAFTHRTLFELQMLEVVGHLVTMLHWQRGIIDSCVQTKAINLEGEWLENWNRVIKNLETFEQFVWEIAPSRAMLPVLRHHRLTGEWLDNFEVATAKDSQGRTPYQAENLDDMEDLLRKLMDCRIYANNSTQE